MDGINEQKNIHIAYFDKLQGEWDIICKTLGITDIDLPTINASGNYDNMAIWGDKNSNTRKLADSVFAPEMDKYRFNHPD